LLQHVNEAFSVLLNEDERAKAAEGELIELAETEDKAMAALYDTSKLPRSPDHKSIDKLCIDVVEEMLKR